MSTVAVILAGGTGRRFGTSTPKQLIRVAGRPILEHTIAAFDGSPAVAEILVVMTEEHAAEARRIAAPFPKATGVCAGGDTRTGSTIAALECLAERPDDDLVLFHDAARPFVDHRVIGDCVAALSEWEAVAVAVPSSDTVVVVDGDTVVEMPRRERLRRFQTPQGFRLGTIRAAYERAGADPEFAATGATDDCGVVHRYLPGVDVHVVAGSEANIKITHPTDLAIAEGIMRDRADAPGSAGRTDSPVPS
jgi:2-C-methyl-D-erythritol 4-phosphate cytidylyltransferase